MVTFKSLNIWICAPSTYVLLICCQGTIKILANLILMRLCLELGLIETITFSLWIHPCICNMEISIENNPFFLIMLLSSIRPFVQKDFSNFFYWKCHHLIIVKWVPPYGSLNSEIKLWECFPKCWILWHFLFYVFFNGRMIIFSYKRHYAITPKIEWRFWEKKSLNLGWKFWNGHKS